MQATRRKIRWNRLAVVLCGLLAAGNAGAQAVVIDPTHIIKTVFGHYSKYVQDAIQYGKEIDEWKRTYEHYRQQLIQGNVYRAQAGQVPGFTKRDPDQGLAESCPMPGIADTLATQQFELCQQIVRAQNAQYNEIVKILETANRRDQELQQIYADRQSVGTDQGRLAANDNQLSSFQARVQMDVQYAELVVDTYDSYLARLKEDQVRLAREVLTGKAGVAGDIVRGAALSGALKAARKRDR
jgi:hypothetical protein